MTSGKGKRSTTVFTTQEAEINKLPDGRLDKNHTHKHPKAKVNILLLHKFSYYGEKLTNITARLLRSQQQSALRRQKIIIKDYYQRLLSAKAFP